MKDKDTLKHFSNHLISRSQWEMYTLSIIRVLQSDLLIWAFYEKKFWFKGETVSWKKSSFYLNNQYENKYDFFSSISSMNMTLEVEVKKFETNT